MVLPVFLFCELKTSNTRYRQWRGICRIHISGRKTVLDGKLVFRPGQASKKKKKKKLVIFASNMNVRQFSVLFYRRFRQKNRRNSVCDEFPSSMNSAILG